MCVAGLAADAAACGEIVLRTPPLAAGSLADADMCGESANPATRNGSAYAPCRSQRDRFQVLPCMAGLPSSRPPEEGLPAAPAARGGISRSPAAPCLMVLSAVADTLLAEGFPKLSPGLSTTHIPCGQLPSQTRICRSPSLLSEAWQFFGCSSFS